MVLINIISCTHSCIFKIYLNKIKLSAKPGFMVFICLFAFKANAQIVQAPSVNDIKTYTSQFDDKDTIVLFDLKRSFKAVIESVLANNFANSVS